MASVPRIADFDFADGVNDPDQNATKRQEYEHSKHGNDRCGFLDFLHQNTESVFVNVLDRIPSIRAVRSNFDTATHNAQFAVLIFFIPVGLAIAFC